MHNLPDVPWSYQSVGGRDHLGSGHVYILDANGRKIASLWGKPEEKLALAEAICDLSEKLARKAA